MSGEKPDPIAAVLASGFPFQMGVEHEVFATRGLHRWEIIGNEFGYPAADGSIAFADLVLRRGQEHLVIECKRHEAEWIFLRASGAGETADLFSRWRRQKVYVPNNSQERRGWSRFAVAPPSPEASFCVIVAKSGERNLEPIAQFASAAADALGTLLFGAVNGPNDETWHLVAPIIVTTATLSVCDIPVSELDLGTGRVDPKSLRRQEVEFLRFRKAFGPMAVLESGILQDIKELHEANQRTVLVVHARALIHLLQRWDLSTGPGVTLPWDR